VIDNKEFAPEAQKDPETGWYLFPRDVEYRKSLFPQGVFRHPAKANCYLIEALVDYITKPGDSIIDPFGGTGTLMLAARRGRKVVLIDVEEPFVQLQREALQSWSTEGGKGYYQDLQDVYLYHGDNRQVLQQLPFLCDSAIFSPPYSSQALGGKVGFKEWRESGDVPDQYLDVGEYGGQEASPMNMGRLNVFMFAQAQNLLYQRLAARLVPGAKIAVITKDIMKGPVREFISTPTLAAANKAGFKQVEWIKWKPPGSMMKKVLKSKGASVVDEEDLLILQKAS
jgi:hypothetical protein